MKVFKSYIMALILAVISLSGSAQEIMSSHYRKVLVIGAHPDDAEYMCAGTMMKLAGQGCEVVSVYFTQGEAGIPGKTHEEARQIRHQECLDACAIMGVRAAFLTQVDGASVVNKDAYAEMKALIDAEKPDMVITHWPLDRHRDHRNCAILTYDAWYQSGWSFDLYYTEVTTSSNTSNFTPTEYVNISDFHDRKYDAIHAHRSQLNEPYEAIETTMETFRGLESHCKYAEAFVKQQPWNAE